ncbi:hypothetical protein GO755_20400 [Spirosoma sp. HMF4905]|uniref:Uncharacterized protein n=1 Tax=Spirosoma arboris TaxID=2682092 RepID=A0A7K1SF21_9BACT|nr:hypothetical protein [Spirosoma arboris]MVM32419.1 hypothetical protein [Spirosoma arboris]
MKKNLYYRTVYKRTNLVKETILAYVQAFSSYPRLLLEVFIRRNFGERYFSFSGAITILAILIILPFYWEFGWAVFDERFFRYINHHINWGNFLGHYFTWYLFLAGFLYMSLKREAEVSRLPSVYDFKRFSLSTGLIHPRFYDLKLNGKYPSERTISIWLEPGLFFGIGFLLWVLDQELGSLLIICSIIYSLSYSASYHQGDNFVMDKIDEMICNEELVKAFVHDRNSDETRGFSFQGRRPADPETRRKVAETFVEDDLFLAL